jgi:cyclopropane-fatty-acyl-phospholipid synthase
MINTQKRHSHQTTLGFGLPKSLLFSRDAGAIDRLARKILVKKLSGIRYGKLVLHTDGETLEFGKLHASEAPVSVWIHRNVAYSKITFGGSVGVGESYIDGDWDASDLTALIQLFVRNRETLNALDSGLGSLLSPILRALHRTRKNENEQARKNIVAHYDLGNDFFNLFLDSSWMYSSGIFPRENASLAEAQFEKNDRICRKLGLTEKDHLIEIGTGWGGFAIHAAKHYGCRVTTTTISSAQYALAKERIEKENLAEKITLLKEDYRNLKGKYDHLVSIEMIEAVGIEYLDTYFQKCSSLLKEGGTMMIQAILMRDQFFEQARKNVDFIQTHVFPGSAIPSLRRILQAIETQTDLKLDDLKDFGQDYARTLNHWAENLNVNVEKVTELGYSPSLIRLWKFYFAYCEGGFREKSITVSQLLFSRNKNV